MTPPPAHHSLVATFRHRTELDGLRAIAVVAVLLFHAGLGLPGGYVGVDVFFVLSGYLITSLIVRDLESGRFTFMQFWGRRARRILPASITLVLSTLLAGSVLLMPSDFSALGDSAIATAAFGANVFFWRSVDYFTTNAEEIPLLHMWSLAVEEQFYFVVPFLLWACRASGRLRRADLFSLVSITVLTSVVVACWMVPRMPAAAVYLLPSRVWEMGLGALAALAPPRWLPAHSPTRSASAWLGLAAIGLPCFAFDQATPFPGATAILPCLGTASFILANQRPPTDALPLPIRALSSRPCVAVGLVSYSLYLWHWPIFAFTRYWAIDPLSLTTRVFLCLVSLAIASVSWRFVETPFRTKAIAASAATMLRGAVVALLVIAASGFAVRAHFGFPSRYSRRLIDLSEAGLRTVAAPSVTLTELRAGRVPSLGDPANPPTLLVWGDSHAMAILPAIEALCQEHGVSAVYAVHSSTTPVLHYVHTDRYSRGDKAPEFASAVIDYVQIHRVPNVLLAARWSGYFAEDRERTSTRVEGRLPRDIEFGDALRDTTDALMAAGAHPFILMEVPNHLAAVPKVLRVRLMTLSAPKRLTDVASSGTNLGRCGCPQRATTTGGSTNRPGTADGDRNASRGCPTPRGSSPPAGPLRRLAEQRSANGRGG